MERAEDGQVIYFNGKKRDRKGYGFGASACAAGVGVAGDCRIYDAPYEGAGTRRHRLPFCFQGAIREVPAGRKDIGMSEI